MSWCKYLAEDTGTWTDNSGSDDDVRLFCGILDGFVFLPISDLPAWLDHLREHTPEGLEPLIDYFYFARRIHN